MLPEECVRKAVGQVIEVHGLIKAALGISGMIKALVMRVLMLSTARATSCRSLTDVVKVRGWYVQPPATAGGSDGADNIAVISP
jgi:hypothetical protein